MRSSHRILDLADAEVRRSSPGLAAVFDSFAEQTRADGPPRRERLTMWFAARPAAVLVLAAGAVIIAAGLAFLASQPGPCRSGAYNPSAPRPPAAAATAVVRGAMHLSSCQVTGNPSAQPKQVGNGLDR